MSVGLRKRSSNILHVQKCHPFKANNDREKGNCYLNVSIYFGERDLIHEYKKKCSILEQCKLNTNLEAH